MRSSPRLLPPLAGALLLATGCIGPSVLADARPVVMTSGARLPADSDRMLEIHDWVLAQLETITCRRIVNPRPNPQPTVGDWDDPPDFGRRSAVNSRPRVVSCLFGGSVNPGARVASYRDQDPLIHVSVVPGPSDVYPWETLVIQGDTARVQVPRGYPDIRTAYAVYAYLHLMDKQQRLERWLPGSVGATGFELERAIVKRMADVWLMGRASFYLDPHRPMDELLNASEAGYLDAFLLTARAEEFADARRDWERENPGGLEAYRAWFTTSFGREPPGLRVAGRRE